MLASIHFSDTFYLIVPKHFFIPLICRPINISPPFISLSKTLKKLYNPSIHIPDPSVQLCITLPLLSSEMAARICCLASLCVTPSSLRSVSFRDRKASMSTCQRSHGKLSCTRQALQPLISQNYPNLRTFAPKSSHTQIFSKLSLQVENDKIRLKT